MNFSSSSESFEKFIKMQQLFELEEIIYLKHAQKKISEHNKSLDETERAKAMASHQQNIKKLKLIWNDRLIGFSKNSNAWENLAQVRSLLFSKTDYFEFYFDFAQTYIQEKKFSKCEHLIEEIRRDVRKAENVDEKKIKLLKLL